MVFLPPTWLSSQRSLRRFSICISSGDLDDVAVLRRLMKYDIQEKGGGYARSCGAHEELPELS